MKYTRSTSQGFAIIELAFVILFIVILAIVAIPNYQDYSEKGHNLEPLTLTSPVIVDGIERQLTVGSVVIGNPNKVERGEAKKVHVILDAKKEINDLFRLLPGEFQWHGEKVKISNRMQAVLSSQDFDVSPETPEIQAVGTDKPVKWQWSIKPKPKSKGECELTITLSAIISLQGQPTPKVLNTYSRKIFVSVSTPSKVWMFLQENMGWLWAPATVIIGFIWSLFRRAKKSKAENEKTSNN